MRKKIAYILTWFPMFSESFVYNEIRNLQKAGCEIETAVALHARHDDVETGIDTLQVIYPPALFVMLTQFFVFLIRHPLKFLELTFLLAVMHRGELFSLKPGRTSFLRGFLLLPLLIWIHKRLGNRDLHFHAHFTVMATTAAMVLARLRRSTYSFTGHGSDILVYRPRNLNRRINGASFMITVSQYNKRTILKQFPDVDARKVHVIPAGINIAQFQCRRSQADIGPRTVIRLITVGRLSAEKGHELFLRALAGFALTNTQFSYDLIGDGPLRGQLQSLVAELGLDERVRFFGFKDQAFITNALRASHLFVLTSSSEGFPVVLMEAAAAGLPILATRITAIPEIVADGVNGILVEPGDEQALYAALKMLAENSWGRLRSLYAAAGTQDLHRFDGRQTIAQIKHLFDAVD